MVAFTTGILDSNVDRASGVGMALTTEKSITIIVQSKSGKHKNHEVCLEVSGGSTPEGDFIDLPESVIVGAGVKTLNHNVGYVKATVSRAEGEDSSVNVTIIAR